MKKLVIALVFVSLMLTCACSVQENVSADIFFNRLSKNCTVLDFEGSEQFLKDNKHCCFVKDANGAEFAFEITVNESGDAQKISLACDITKIPTSLMKCIESVIKTYSPEDDIKEVFAALFENGKIKQGNAYHETQWRKYSCYAAENDFFFCVQNKKLIKETKVELSLKPNDRVDF